MKKNGIVFKLFLLIFSTFFCFFLVTYLGQSFFLEQYYTDKKEDVVREELKKFVSQYKSTQYNYQEVQEQANDFYNRTNAFVAIVDEEGFVKTEASFYIKVMLSPGREVVLSLNNALLGNDAEKLLQLDLEKGTKVNVQGLYYDGVIHPILIQTDKGYWKNDFFKSTINYSTIEFHGTINEENLPAKADIAYSNRMNMFIRGVQSWFIGVKEERIQSIASVYDYTDSLNGIKNKVFVEPISLPNGEREYIFAMTSLQPVSEAMIVIKDFYLYAFLIVFLLLGGLTYYLSRWVAKPLLQMNESARRMAKLDFSKKINLQREDEIGELGESINELSNNLETTIRNLKVANEQLLSDIEKERKLENTRKEFISGVSHELKTPLSIVKSYAEGIKDGIAKNRSGEYLDVILDEVDKMEHLIGDMLELARLESDGIHLTYNTFNLKEITEEIVARMRFLSEEKELNIELHLMECYVKGDQNRIEQVLINFIRNAIQYTPPQEKIEIIMLDSDKNIQVSIRNYGVDIPDDKMEQIWERFYRVDQARHRENGGTGLGLAITKTILQLHHSSFYAAKIKGGVEFSFTLKKSEKFTGCSHEIHTTFIE